MLFASIQYNAVEHFEEHESSLPREKNLLLKFNNYSLYLIAHDTICLPDM